MQKAKCPTHANCNTSHTPHVVKHRQNRGHAAGSYSIVGVASCKYYRVAHHQWLTLYETLCVPDTLCSVLLINITKE